MQGTGTVPKGHLTIAQRFSAGEQRPERKIRPEGTIEVLRDIPAVPSGLGRSALAHPALKRWAILKHPFGITWNRSELGRMSASRCKVPELHRMFKGSKLI